MKSVLALTLAFNVSCAVNKSQLSASESGASLARILRDHHKDPNVYKAGQCGSNVRNLVQLYRQQGGDISGTKFVLLLYEVQKRSGIPGQRVRLQPQRTASGTQAQGLLFDYHAIVVDRGTVYDFDFGPTAKKIENYAPEMFDRPNRDKKDPNEVDILKRVMTVVVPAEEYLQVWQRYADEISKQDPHHTKNHEEYARGKTTTYYKEKAGKDLPLRSLDQLITDLAEARP